MTRVADQQNDGAGVREMRHPQLVIRSAELYAQHLQSATYVSTGGRCAAEAIVETVHAAVAKRESLEPRFVSATWRHLAGAYIADAEAFVNHWQLGYGSDAARLISIGTEHAYDLMPKLHDQPTDVGLAEMTMECLVAVFWLCGSRPDVMAKIAGAPWWHWSHDFSLTRPYHIYAADYYKVSPRSTWPTIGRDLLKAGPDWKTALGDGCYQIELSAFPSLRSIGGRPPSEARLSFLKSAVGEMRSTARVLVFHGTPKYLQSDPRDAIAGAFLGVRSLGAPTQIGHDSARREWRVYDSGEHRVLFTRALSGQNVSAEYMDRVSRLVAEAMPAGEP